ncbi:MAG: c-type cytochrome [Bryobacteraceae bacterium]
MTRTALLLLLACCAGRGRPRQSQTSVADRERGRQIYLKNCQVCHGENGAGIPEQFPPLVQNHWVNGDPKPLIAIVLDGMKGEQVIDSMTYRGLMPAWRDSLTAPEIAAVLTFVRASWGNHVSAVEASDVQKLRKETATRKNFWTEDELRRLKP